MRSLELAVDVTVAAALGEPARVAVTVTLPDEVAREPVVCFAKPGGGYSRRYYTEDLPGPRPGSGAQAAFHAARGWVFVSIDHLGVGDSTTDHDPDRLTFTPVVAANQATEQEVLGRLRAGTLADGFPPVADPLLLGIGQSMGGAFTVLQQGRFHCYEGIAVLGYGVLHTQPPAPPGETPVALPWIPRDVSPSAGIFTNGPALAETDADGAAGGLDAMAWGFHFDDVERAVVRRDLDDFPNRHGDPPPWASTTVPSAAAIQCLAPGATATEAAGIRCPVLLAVGERDVVPDPRGEVRAYLSSPSVDLFVCPRMAHMHNFAGTRELLWRRLDTWAVWARVAAST